MRILKVVKPCTYTEELMSKQLEGARSCFYCGEHPDVPYDYMWKYDRAQVSCKCGASGPEIKIVGQDARDIALDAWNGLINDLSNAEPYNKISGFSKYEAHPMSNLTLEQMERKEYLLQLQMRLTYISLGLSSIAIMSPITYGIFLWLRN